MLQDDGLLTYWYLPSTGETSWELPRTRARSPHASLRAPLSARSSLLLVRSCSQAQYQQRRYGLPGPKTAALRLPLGPHGAAGSAAFAAFAAQNRPQTAPV